MCLVDAEDSFFIDFVFTVKNFYMLFDSFFLDSTHWIALYDFWIWWKFVICSL